MFFSPGQPDENLPQSAQSQQNFPSFSAISAVNYRFPVLESREPGFSIHPAVIFTC
jgi:hypothetical protein